MNIKMLLLNVFVFILIAGCGKEEIHTSGELIAKELQAIIETENTYVFNIRNSESNIQGSGVFYIGSNSNPVHSFKGDLICFDTDCYNLNRLTEFFVTVYQSPDDTDPPMIVLVMDL